jgi:hypothetical protein
MPEEPRKYQTLESKLYIEELGTIEVEAILSPHSDPRIEVEVWDIPQRKYLWNGTPEEFWNLILTGIAVERLMSTCPKCGGTNRDHARSCPLVALAKKEGLKSET